MGRLKSGQLSELKGLKDSFIDEDNIDKVDSRSIIFFDTPKYQKYYREQQRINSDYYGDSDNECGVLV